MQASLSKIYGNKKKPEPKIMKSNQSPQEKAHDSKTHYRNPNEFYLCFSKSCTWGRNSHGGFAGCKGKVTTAA